MVKDDQKTQKKVYELGYDYDTVTHHFGGDNNGCFSFSKAW